MPEPITSQQLSLVDSATRIINNIPLGTLEHPNEDHTVSSAVLCSNGQIYVGANLYHFTGGPCAELVAFANAAAGGVRSGSSPGIGAGEAGVEGGVVRAVCVVAVGNAERGVLSPCGRCREIMLEYHPDIRVIVKAGGGSGELVTVGLQELLPFAYVNRE